MTQRRIDLEPVGGIAGDMFAAALLDAFPELHSRVCEHLMQCGVPSGVRVALQRAVKQGFSGTRFHVEQDTQDKPPRTFQAVSEFLDTSRLPDEVKACAIGIFRLLGEAEAHVHGSTLERIHFHEVSDWDSMVDIVAAASLVCAMGDAIWRIGALPLGGGTVNTAHGDIPVPAPASAQLLTGFLFHDDGIAGERVTPTGAAIVRYLCTAPGRVPSAVAGTLARIGVGCGTRDLKGRANILRATVFEAHSPIEHDTVEQLAFEIDDMTGEELAIALGRLREAPGVLDVSHLAMSGKKGRPVVGVRMLVEPSHGDAVAELCLLETSTLGVRRLPLARRVLPRHQLRVVEHDVSMDVKRAERPDHTVSAKVESDALADTATLQARRALALRAEHSALGDEHDH